MEALCGYCGFYGEMVFVHSHYQCPRCHNNIMPCCEGVTEEDIDEEAMAEEADEETETEKDQEKH